jgi:hypothetical protein
MLCSLALDGLKLFFCLHRRSAYGMVHWEFLRVRGHNSWVGTICGYPNRLYYGIRCFDALRLCYFSLVSCGYLVVRVMIVIVARSAPLAAISVWSIIFGWSRSLVMVCVFSICELVGNVHELWYCPWFSPAHLFDEVLAVEPEYEGIDCSLLRDVLCWVFYAPVLYIQA